MIEGSCHCGAVRWRFDRIPESATACSCTVCRRYGGVLWAYDYENEGIVASGATRALLHASFGLRSFSNFRLTIVRI
jgi:hypothetical protein